MRGDLYDEAFLASFQTQPVVPAPARMWPGDSNPLDDLRRYAEMLKNLPPPPARIEVSELVLDVLTTAAAPPLEMTWSNTLLGPTGVPVVVDKDLPVGAWRVLDVDGNVIREGTMLPRKPDEVRVHMDVAVVEVVEADDTSGTP